MIVKEWVVFEGPKQGVGSARILEQGDRPMVAFQNTGRPVACRGAR